MKKLLVAMMAFLVGGACSAQQTGYTNQSNAEFAAAMADPTVQIVDVRTSAEYAEGHILGAVNIDVNGADFLDQTARLDKNSPVAVYCRSGMRSRTAAGKLVGQGFRVSNLKGGIVGWDGEVTK